MASAAAEKPQCKVFLANTIANGLSQEVQEGLKKINRKPKLVGFLANTDPHSRTYAEYTGKTCVENGFDFELRECDRESLEDAICTANTDPSVDGIMVYYPIFNSRQDQYLQSLVALDKDVEGLSMTYLSNMYHNVRFLDDAQTKKSILPCTPLAVIKILEYLRIYNTILPYGNRLHGRTITVINRSEVVGRPLAALLANDGASVYSVDIADVQQFTRGEGLRQRAHKVVEKPGMKLEDVLPLSDVVISGVPGDKFKVPLNLLKDGAVCINFSSNKNFGETPAVKEKASIFVPSVGKVTIMVLLRNLLRMAQHNDSERQKAEEAKTDETEKTAA